MTLRKLTCLATALAWALSAIAAPALSGTPTAQYLLSKPTVSADADTWGTQINADLDSLDPILYGKCDLAGGVPVAASGVTPGTAGCKFTGLVTFATGTTTLAPFKFQAGTNLTSPAAGAVEWNGTNLFVTQTSGPTRQTLAYLSSSITGSAASLTTGQTISMTGDVAYTSAAFNGTGGVTGTGTIQAGVVTSAKMASGAAVANIGFTPANAAGQTFTGEVVTKASATGGAGLNLIPGVAPTSPANGDCWITATLFGCHIGGANVTLGSSSGSGLLSTNNLSDVASASTSRTNLGLGTAAVQNTGTSGANVPLLNGANTWSGNQALSAARLTLAVNTSTQAPVYFQGGSIITTPQAGAFESDGVRLFFTHNTDGVRKQVAYIDDNITGSAATLTTGRTISLTGDVAYTSGAFDGSGNVTGSATIQAAAVTNADLANVATATIKGRSAAGTGAPSDLSATTARSVILPAMGTKAGQVLTVNSGGTDAAWSGFPVFASAYVTVSGTTPTVAANNNISGVARTGGGTYTVTFNTAAPDANFAMVVTGAGTASQVCQEDGTFSRTTTTAGVTCFNGGGQHDPTAFNVTVVAQ